jgi:hypothetical protein
VTVRGRNAIADGVAAGVLAAVGSGAPSTLHALLVRASPLEATLAAGTLLLRRETRPLPLVLAAVPAHLGISLSSGVVMALTLPRRWTVAAGGLSGLAIAMLDLGIFAARFPRIRALPLWPQVADHLAYGVIVGVVVARLRAARGELEAGASVGERERAGSRRALTTWNSPCARSSRCAALSR